MATKLFQKRRTVKRGWLYYVIAALLFILAIVCLAGMCVMLRHLIIDMRDINALFNKEYGILNGNVSQEQMKQLKLLDNVYKSSRSFEVMSFIYMFVSTIGIGLAIHFYNTINSMTSEYEKYLNSALKEIKGLSDSNEILNCVSMISHRLNILESLFVHKTDTTGHNKSLRNRQKARHSKKNAAQFQKILNTTIDYSSESLIRKYLPRLREDFLKSFRILSRIKKDKNKIVYLDNQITYLQGCFYEFIEKVETLYKLNPAFIEEDTKNEFLDLSEECLKILKELKLFKKSST